MSKVTEVDSLVAACEQEGVVLRFLGGVAIAINVGRADSPHREFSDIDGVVGRKHVKGLKRLLDDRGYEGEQQFNALNGNERLIYYGPVGKLDVFVEEFRMCHRIPLGDRLSLDSPTLTAVDLLLTKLQVVELNDKDLADIVLLLDSHEIVEDSDQGIDGKHLGEMLGKDWGLWKTTGLTLEKVRQAEPSLGPKIDRLEQMIEGAPKSMKFRRRAIVGERTKWYDEPEET